MDDLTDLPPERLMSRLHAAEAELQAASSAQPYVADRYAAAMKDRNALEAERGRRVRLAMRSAP